MTSSQPKNAAGDILRLRDEFMQRARQEEARAQDLENQARSARQSASELTRRAQVMNEAFAFLQMEEILKTGVMKLEDLDKKSAAKIAKTRFVFLVDGSGSMNGRLLSEAVDGLVQTSAKLTAQGAKVEAVLFGDKQPVGFDLQDPAVCARAKGGLNCGTDMVFSVEALAATLKKNQRTHIIVLGDGDLFDVAKVKPVLETILRDFPKTTLDAVQLSARAGRTAASYAAVEFARATGLAQQQTQMQRLVDGLQVSAARPRPQMAHVLPEATAEAIGDLLAKRLSHNTPAVKKTPALKKPGSGK